MSTKRLLTVVVCASVALQGVALAADPGDAAKDVETLYREAMDAVQREDFAIAATKFDVAYAKQDDHVLLWNAARAHHQAGHLELARKRYRACLQHPSFPADKRTAVADYLVEIEVAMRADEPPSGPAADPPGPVPVESLPSPQSEPVADVAVPPPPKTPAPGDDDGPGWFPWVLAGTGVVLIGAGITLQLVAEGDRDDLREDLKVTEGNVVTGVTQHDAYDQEEDANGTSTLGVIGMAVGGAALMTGVVWIVADAVSDEPSRSSVHVTGGIGPDGPSVGIQGRF